MDTAAEYIISVEQKEMWMIELWKLQLNRYCIQRDDISIVFVSMYAQTHAHVHSDVHA